MTFGSHLGDGAERERWGIAESRSGSTTVF